MLLQYFFFAFSILFLCFYKTFSLLLQNFFFAFTILFLCFCNTFSLLFQFFFFAFTILFLCFYNNFSLLLQKSFFAFTKLFVSLQLRIGDISTHFSNTLSLPDQLKADTNRHRVLNYKRRGRIPVCSADPLANEAIPLFAETPVLGLLPL